MGPKRVQAVWKVFANLEALGKADAEEIANRAGIPGALAEAVRERARSVGGAVRFYSLRTISIHITAARIN